MRRETRTCRSSCSAGPVAVGFSRDHTARGAPLVSPYREKGSLEFLGGSGFSFPSPFAVSMVDFSFLSPEIAVILK